LRDRVIGAAELKRDGMLALVECEQTLPVAVDNGARRQHLRVQPPAPSHQAMEDAAMPVGPIHHGCNGKSIR
jgi:hypothetical protein